MKLRRHRATPLAAMACAIGALACGALLGVKDELSFGDASP
jgi:hypothetical protein